jgi:heat shock protein HslJ
VVVVLLAIWLLAGCADRPVEAVAAAPITAEELANAYYLGIYDEPVRLSDGEYVGQPFVAGGAARPRVLLIPRFSLAGDLTGDGNEEAVVLLAESSGGSGTFDYIAVMSRSGNDVVNIGTAALGDRVQIRDASLEDGRVRIDVVQGGPKDAACCPTQKATRSWAIENDQLVEVETEVEGPLSGNDLEGVEWVLVSLGEGEDTPAEPELTLVFDGERVAGHSGCNRYMGGVTVGDGNNELEFGPLAGTMMACPPDLMDLERKYLKALAGARRFSFLVGQLVLTSVDDDEQASTMIFEGRPPRM